MVSDDGEIGLKVLRPAAAQRLSSSVQLLGSNGDDEWKQRCNETCSEENLPYWNPLSESQNYFSSKSERGGGVLRPLHIKIS
jgi:hypothetical protein